MLLTAMKVLGTRVVFGKLNANIAIWEILGLENSVLPQEGFVMHETILPLFMVSLLVCKLMLIEIQSF